MDLVSRTCGVEIRVMTSCMRLDTQQIENIEAKISNTRPRCPTEMQPNEDGSKVEYWVWNPFRSKLAAVVLCGVDNIWIVRGITAWGLGRRS
ncbi:rRNA 2'-O-methyltransferase fibrillarin-like isoform X2 [Triticum aestivum]|uniref:rRNA 2'-O-methyltransferase fibrillarin-like isoform X2 n=1 Tax=Triticum aestivum TaxID=4565 RepID=UPI001D02E038|nr:rRNA 2'-O-methyltransferase fibrillarin-like isoform X2 [Triticum aestivum]